MTIKELMSVVYDDVIIYKAVDEGFEDIYKGDRNSIPPNILAMNARAIGADKKGNIDIQVDK